MNKWFDAKCYEWAVKRGVDIEISTLPITDLNAKLMTLVEAGSPPDITFPGLVGAFSEMPESRVLEPVDDVINELDRTDFYDYTLKINSVDGKAYAVPIGAELNVLHYRKDIFGEVGYPEPPETWYELFDAMKEVKKRHPEMYPLGLCMGDSGEDDVHNFVTLWYCFGGKEITERSTKGLHFNEQPTIDTYNFVMDCWNAELIPPDALTWTGPGNNKAYMSGRSAVVINATSIYYAMVKQGMYDLVEATICPPPPKGPRGDRCIYGGCPSIMIFKDCKYKDLAKDLIIHLLKDKDGYRENFIKASYCFEAPVFKSVAEEIAKTGPWWEKMMESAALYRINYPLGEPSKAIDEIHTKGMYGHVYHRIIIDGLSVEEAVEEAHKKMEEIFLRVYGK